MLFGRRRIRLFSHQQSEMNLVKLILRQRGEPEQHSRRKTSRIGNQLCSLNLFFCSSAKP